MRQENLQSVTLDERGRDQFLVRHGDMTTINWYDPVKPTEVALARKITDGSVFWSPQGSYLGSFHQQGLILWGGPNWDKLQRLAHQNVLLVDFSPCERFLVSSNKTASEDVRFFTVFTAVCLLTVSV